MSSIVAAAKEQLKPHFERVLETVKGPMEQSFFTEGLLRLTAAEQDEQILELFFHLSSTAFMGCEFGPKEQIVIDDLLAQAEQIAFALSADEAGGAH